MLEPSLRSEAARDDMRLRVLLVHVDMLDSPIVQISNLETK